MNNDFLEHYRSIFAILLICATWVALTAMLINLFMFLLYRQKKRCCEDGEEMELTYQSQCPEKDPSLQHSQAISSVSKSIPKVYMQTMTEDRSKKQKCEAPSYASVNPSSQGMPESYVFEKKEKEPCCPCFKKSKEPEDDFMMPPPCSISPSPVPPSLPPCPPSQPICAEAESPCPSPLPPCPPPEPAYPPCQPQPPCIQFPSQATFPPVARFLTGSDESGDEKEKKTTCFCFKQAKKPDYDLKGSQTDPCQEYISPPKVEKGKKSDRGCCKPASKSEDDTLKLEKSIRQEYLPSSIKSDKGPKGSPGKTCEPISDTYRIPQIPPQQQQVVPSKKSGKGKPVEKVKPIEKGKKECLCYNQKSDEEFPRPQDSPCSYSPSDKGPQGSPGKPCQPCQPTPCQEPAFHPPPCKVTPCQPCPPPPKIEIGLHKGESPSTQSLLKPVEAVVVTKAERGGTKRPSKEPLFQRNSVPSINKGPQLCEAPLIKPIPTIQSKYKVEPDRQSSMSERKSDTARSSNYMLIQMPSKSDEKSVDEVNPKYPYCCRSSKAVSSKHGEIHPQIVGYKVLGHVKVKGNNLNETISIPEDSYDVLH